MPRRSENRHVLQTSDVIRAAQIGLVLGGAVGAVLGVVAAVFFPIVGDSPQWGMAGVLAVLGAKSGPMFVEGHALVRQWIPQSEAFVLPGATHTLQMENPRGLAEALTGFFARHPLPIPA